MKENKEESICRALPHARWPTLEKNEVEKKAKKKKTPLLLVNRVRQRTKFLIYLEETRVVHARIKIGEELRNGLLVLV